MAICLIHAAPNTILGFPASTLMDTHKSDNLREAVTKLSQSGLEIYYYNEQQVIAGGEASKHPEAKPLCKADSAPLYLVTKFANPQLPAACGKVLLDLGSMLLLQSELNEVELRQLITNPFTPLELKPMQLSPDTPILQGLNETRTAIETMIAQVSADSVLASIQSLQDFQTRYALADNRMIVANWIKNQFIRFGISNANLHSFQWQGTTQYNVVATITGSVYPDTYIVVGGHHDSITNATPLTFAPGADDNASGTVAAIEMARVMMATGFQPKCSIRFVTFAAEEFGLWGSKAYAQYADTNDMDIRLMINHDMIANTNPSPTDLRVLLMPYDGFMQHTDHAAALTTQYTSLVPVYGSMNLSASDSYSFWQRGFPVIYYFEYNFSQVYHSNNDITANINPVYCAEVIRSSTAVAASYANMPSAPANLRVLDTGTGTSLGVFWDTVPDPSISSYTVYWGTESGEYPFSQTYTGTQCTLSGLSEGQTYYVAISSLDASGNESYRVFGSGIPLSIPLTPLNFSDAPVLGGINLAWTPNTELDLASYRLYRSLDPEVQGELLVTLSVGASSYTDANLSGSSAYYCYRLTAVDSQGNQSPFTATLQSRPVTLDQGILVIDESKDFSGANPFQPTDAMVDDFYSAAMDNFVNPSLLDLEASELTLRLADIGIYSSILWHGNDFADVNYPYSVKEALKQYVNLGGNILFSVYQPSQAFELNAGYPASFAASTFINEVLGISGVEYDNSARFKYAVSQLLDFPTLTVDSLKTSTSFNGHIFRVEGLTPVAGAQSLYTYGSDYASTTAQGSQNDQVVGVMHAYGLGKTVTLSFPLYHMQLSSSRAMLDYAFGVYFNEPTAAEDPFIPALAGIRLLSGYPNPFTNDCYIPLKTSDLHNPVKVQIYNLKGQLVKSLWHDVPQADTVLRWDGKDNAGKSVASGIYYAKAAQNGAVSTRKIMLVK